MTLCAEGCRWPRSSRSGDRLSGSGRCLTPTGPGRAPRTRSRSRTGFHLWENLGEAVEKTVVAHRGCLPELAVEPAEPSTVEFVVPGGPGIATSRHQSLRPRAPGRPQTDGPHGAENPTVRSSRSSDDDNHGPAMAGADVSFLGPARQSRRHGHEAVSVNGLLIAAISLGATSITSTSWMVVRWRAATVVQRIAERALESCPATRRAEVVLAAADLARCLAADCRTRILPMRRQLLGHRGGSDDKV